MSQKPDSRETGYSNVQVLWAIDNAALLEPGDIAICETVQFSQGVMKV